jgi:hypothetical protein
MNVVARFKLSVALLRSLLPSISDCFILPLRLTFVSGLDAAGQREVL